MADGEIKIDHTPGAAQPQPGQVISPGGVQPPANPLPAPTEPTPPTQPEKPMLAEPPRASGPMPVPEPPAPIAPPAQVEVDNSPPFSQGDTPPPADGDVSWTASEFIAHEKSAGWYFGLALATAVIAGLVFLVTRDYISAIVVLVGAFAFGIFAGKKPKQLQYHLDMGGLTIGQKHYGYDAFKSFAIVPEGAFSSIVFMPHKRFAPLTTIYYSPEDEHKVADLLAKHLPFEEHKLDAVDHLMQRIRF